ncbi:hypothetical protein TNCV_2155701 [Trichonephila clavipes]|nr:hypothetical protein TNCV_2155701 [Trichonephila clavipes]
MFGCVLGYDSRMVEKFLYAPLPNFVDVVRHKEKVVTPKYLDGLPVDRDRRNVYPGFTSFMTNESIHQGCDSESTIRELTTKVACSVGRWPAFPVHISQILEELICSKYFLPQWLDNSGALAFSRNRFLASLSLASVLQFFSKLGDLFLGHQSI